MPIVPIIWASTILGGLGLAGKAADETGKAASEFTKLAVVAGGLFVVAALLKKGK